MDGYDRCTNLGEKKILADGVAIYGQGRELFRPLTYNWNQKKVFVRPLYWMQILIFTLLGMEFCCIRPRFRNILCFWGVFPFKCVPIVSI